MRLIEAIRIAITSLLAGKLRAALTMLGVVIGVAAVVALLSIGAAVQQLIIDRFDILGTNLLFVYSEPRPEEQLPAQLDNNDLEALADPLLVPAALAVGAQFLQSAQISAAAEAQAIEVAGTTANYPLIRNADVAIGRYFGQADVDVRARVVVLGSTVARRLFGSADPINERVRINGMQFTVLGVMAERGSTFGGREDERVFIPLSTAQERLFPPPAGTARRVELSVIYVQITADRDPQAAIDQITGVLRGRRGLTYESSNFSILTQGDLIDAFQIVTGALTIFLGSIAAISLLVGGIGIMNIMLVAVSERTREIGIRRAIGARRSDIAAQFITEAIVLSLAGGLIGIGLGVALTAACTLLLRRLVDQVQTQIDPLTIVLAAGTSIAVGLFFGLYPALRAADLQPVEALRAE
ncbi:MAG: FtsX-like permease family protein [Oscillochloris sp.]|nr:FtsX-like permease family protein [Oscillochloris sp.]